jgi:hypothetical protein
MSWTYRSSSANYYYSSGTPTSLAFNAAQVSGSLLVCAVSAVSGGGANGDVTVSDSVNGTWSKGSGGWYGGGYSYIQLFYIVNSSNSVVTVDFSNWPSGAIYAMILIEEFTGNASSSVLDVCSNGTAEAVSQGTNIAVNAASVTTTVNGDLIYSVFYDESPIVTASSNGTLTAGQWQLYSGNESIGDGYQVQSTHGSLTPTWTLTTNGSATSNLFYVITAAFKPGAGGGTTVSIGNATLSLGPQALSVNRAFVISKGSLATTGEALSVNRAVAIAKAALTVTAQTLSVNRAVAIAKGALSATGQALTALSGTVIAIAKAALTATGQALAVNRVVAVSKAALSATGQVLSVNRAVAISKAALSATGQALNVNRAIAIGSGAVTFAGKSLTVAGAAIVSIAAGTLNLTGKSLTATIGGLRTVTRKYINAWKLWTNKPSGGI